MPVLKATITLCAMPLWVSSATLLLLMQQEIHFVTGKGGVGKSVIAAGLALKKSREGKRVLLVELGEQSFFKDYFDLPSVGFQPVALTQGFSLAQWTGDACLREYATYLIKVESLAKLFFENSVMRAFINVAPALPELAIMGKITSGPRRHGPPLPFDVLIVDGFATGHFLALMDAPRGMAKAVSMGPMGEQSRGIDSVLRNSEICHYHIVTMPEELPIKEASELMESLKSDFGVQANLIINKVLQIPVANEALKESAQSGSELSQFAQYLIQQKERQETILAEAAQFAPNRKNIPLYFESRPWNIIEAIAEELG